MLRLWIKAFLELMPTIVNEFKDNELVDLLLFKLPWLCHGLQANYKVSAIGAISVRPPSSRLGAGGDHGSVNNSSVASGTHMPS